MLGKLLHLNADFNTSHPLYFFDLAPSDSIWKKIFGRLCNEEESTHSRKVVEAWHSEVGLFYFAGNKMLETSTKCNDPGCD